MNALNTESLQHLLGLCSLINIGILTLWWSMIVFAHDSIYHIHRRWFNLSVETFDATHYSAMAYFKLGVILFNIAPFLALYMMP